VKLRQVLLSREEHASAAGVTSPRPSQAFDFESLGAGGVVEVGRGGYAYACEGSAGGVAGG